MAIGENKYIDYLNTELIKPVATLAPVFYTCASNISVSRDGKNKAIPAIRINGEYVPLIYDDRNAFFAYHRVRASQFTVNAQEKVYGDGIQTKLIKTSLCSLIVYAKEDNSDLDICDLLSMIFPTHYPKDRLVQGVDQVRFTVLATDNDSLAIFKREMDGLEYDLKNAVKLFEIKYKIECIFDKSCINKCL